MEESSRVAGILRENYRIVALANTEEKVIGALQYDKSVNGRTMIDGWWKETNTPVELD
jgi:hypothetical protein